ncbi:MAG TPA: DUF4115 domain-containing protein [Alphaproteobacteria bacterium]|nr:DUF4115 domain-containing protein [Alphaproteobacteria bacterium]
MNQAHNMQHSAPQPDLDSYTDMSVGQILRRTREYYGQSLPQVEMNLRIRASQLEALENLELEKLPGRVYAIGFVRSYSEYLGLDGDKMVHLFKAQSVGKRVKPELQFPVTVSESKTPNIYIILFSLVSLILLIAYWTIFYTPTKYVEAVPPVPEALKQGSVALLKPVADLPASEPVEDENGAEQETTAEAPKANKMELVISEDSWVEIKNAKGEAVLRQVLKPGDKYIVPDEEGLLLSTGNAGGITVFIDGKKVEKLGKSTQVRRNLALNPADFVKTN